MTELRRVLFVEDEPDIFQIIQLALTDVGKLLAFGFLSGREALSQVITIQPQLILLDGMMPEMDGASVLRALRAIDGFGTTPVVILTAKSDLAHAEHLTALGASAIFFKPFDPMTLADRLREIWLQVPVRGAALAQPMM